jgi:hypothetical protein
MPESLDELLRRASEKAKQRRSGEAGKEARGAKPSEAGRPATKQGFVEASGSEASRRSAAQPSKEAAYVAPKVVQAERKPPELGEFKIQRVEEIQGTQRGQAREEAAPAAPIVFEFPKITEELASAGILPAERVSKGGVTGIPTASGLPEEEKSRRIPSEWEPIISSTIDVRYPLIEPYTYATIRWNEKTQEVLYTVIEPPLSDKERKTLDRLKGLIVDLLDINLMTIPR